MIQAVNHLILLQKNDVIEVVCKFGVLKQLFGKENHTRKLCNNLKGFKLFMFHLLCQNVPLFSLYICRTRRFGAFGLELSAQFWSKNQTNRFLEPYQIFMNICFMPKCAGTLILYTVQNTSDWTNLILCYYPPATCLFQI